MNRDSMLIEADELLARINDSNLRIYDATILFFASDTDTTAYEKYTEAHIPNAAFFDHDKFSDANSDYRYMVVSENELAKQIGNLGISENSEVIFYTSEMLPCATRAWWLLRYAGHNNVRVLDGGLAAWEAVGGTIEQGTKEYQVAEFECSLRNNMFVNKDDVMAAINDGKVNTVYTLDIETYGGTQISGSSNLPFSNLVQEFTSFSSDKELASQLKDEVQFDRTITYCGGGIAATVNAMAHLMVGNENIAVYDGSLSEWMGEGLPTITNKKA